MIYLTVLKMSIFFYGHRPGAVLKVPSYRLNESFGMIMKHFLRIAN